ncbi:MAG: tol-pal system-associated acyl-CoA thioesterase [Pseudomonadota bacterium]|jgi:acyl-CoA thioester hydrolase
MTPENLNPNPLLDAFRWPLRIYWEDTDAGGVVFYANYLKFFERARTEWLRTLGFSQQAMRLEDQAMFVVTDTQVRHRQPARLDDLVEVTVRLAERGRASMVLEQQAWRDETLLAEGRIRIGCVDAATLRPRRMPSALLSAFGRQP